MASRLALCATVAATVFFAPAVGASAQAHEVTQFVPGSAFHGVHGLGIDKAGRMFAGSVAAAALCEVNRGSGTARIAVATPEGMADDIAFAPDGTVAWTGLLTGDLCARKGDGPIGIQEVDAETGAAKQINIGKQRSASRGVDLRRSGCNKPCG
jgi:hypothetical protein